MQRLRPWSAHCRPWRLFGRASEMTDLPTNPSLQGAAKSRVEKSRDALGPFVAAAENTCMPMIFTDALAHANPLVFANDSFVALTGFDRGQLLGRALQTLLGEAVESKAASSFEAALVNGAAGIWEMQCQRADGSMFLAAVYLSPVHDERGAVRQNFLSFVERDSRIDQIFERRNELHAMYEQAPGFIATSEGPNHRFTFANASYKRLVNRDHLVGLTVAEALPEIADQNFLFLLDQVFETGNPYVGTAVPIRLRTASGSDELRYVNFVYQPVRDTAGQITGLFCEGYDATAERVAADHLAELQSELIHLSRVNAMGTMATTMAHELNQPLAAISSYAAGALRLARLGEREAGAFEHALAGIEEAAQRAGDIIRNLRDFTRRGETEKINFNLKVAVGECMRMVCAGGCFDVELEDLTPDGLMMAGDRIQIQQVLINLLRNACAAAAGSDSPRVTIDARYASDHIIVSVSDTGPGVRPEAAQGIFGWSDSSKEGGMGLGLSISRTIIEAHQGTIWLESSGTFGATFCFSVPADFTGSRRGPKVHTHGPG